MPYFVIPDTSELMVRMLILMGLVTRKITGRQTIQVIDDIADEDNGKKNVGKGCLYSHQNLNIEKKTK